MQVLHDALAPDVEVDGDAGKAHFKLIYPWWASPAAKAEWRRLLALSPIAQEQAMCASHSCVQSQLAVWRESEGYIELDPNVVVMQW